MTENKKLTGLQQVCSKGQCGSAQRPEDWSRQENGPKDVPVQALEPVNTTPHAAETLR